MISFDVKDKIVVFDMSTFIYGVQVSIIENGQVISQTRGLTEDQAMKLSYSLCESERIKNIFVKTLAPMVSNKMKFKFLDFGRMNFSKTFDKINIHML